MQAVKIRQLGFTLIELLVAMAIIGILAAVAYPSYTEYVNRAKRAQAQTAIISLSQAMERYFTRNNTYVGATVGTAAGAVFPSAVPATGTQIYTLSLVTAATSYTITATRLSTGAMKNDTCGDYTFTSAGSKGITNKPTGSTKTVADCWK